MDPCGEQERRRAEQNTAGGRAGAGAGAGADAIGVLVLVRRGPRADARVYMDSWHASQQSPALVRAWQSPCVAAVLAWQSPRRLRHLPPSRTWMVLVLVGASQPEAAVVSSFKIHGWMRIENHGSLPCGCNDVQCNC